MEGVFVDVVTNFKNELTVERPVNNRSSPISVLQFCLKSGTGTVKYIFLEHALRLTEYWKTNSGE